jgi:hypothetical protein
MNKTDVPLFLRNEPIARSVKHTTSHIFRDHISWFLCVSQSLQHDKYSSLLHTQSRTEPSQVELQWAGQKGQNKDTTRNTMWTHSDPQTLQKKNEI